MSSVCLLQRVSDACSPCMFSGRDTGIPSYDTDATHRSSMTHGCDSVPSYPLLLSRVGEEAFSCKPSLPRLGREPSLVRFPGKGERPWAKPASASLGRPTARHITLRGDITLASLGMERATCPVLGPLAQSTDSSPRSCPGNVAPLLPRCGPNITSRVGLAT
jgi:hypothetical protein